MTELLTAAQMRAIEQAAIESGKVTGLELMERAGQGVVDAIFEEWPELCGRAVDQEGGAAPDPADLPRNISGKVKEEGAPWRAVVLCGPGNNGGDGFVVARLLKARGWDVEVFLLGDGEKLPPDARANYEQWRVLGGEPHPWMSTVYDDGSLRERLFGADVVVDALFGTGISRDLGSLHNDVWCAFDLDTGAIHRLVAVDLPSGLCADSGRVLGQDLDSFVDPPARHAFQAELTVTFHRPKLGHFLGHGPVLSGRVVEVDIGLQEGAGRDPQKVQLVMGVSTRIQKTAAQHKFSHGHALVLSGGHGKTGAARLAARGALRIGAGLVTLGSPRSAMFENAAHLTAIMLHQIDGAHGVSELLEDERFNALCLGPGLGRGMDTQAVIFAALKAGRATVLDADALTRFERDPQVLFDILHENCVLTPHGGEFARLFPDLAAKLSAAAETGPVYSKVDATREAAARAGCVVLFKGADTVIADPSGRCSVNAAQYEQAAPWLATAGSGDVLAGFITGLLARRFSPMRAAELGAWLHVECAREFGPGLISEDLPEQLPAVFRRLHG